MPRGNNVDNDYGPIALRENSSKTNYSATTTTTVQTNDGNDEEDEEEAHEFATYVESDDDDEDPYYMPEHNRKSSTLSFSSKDYHVLQSNCFDLSSRSFAF
ncbi:hypothetical protein BDB00DRAFT_869139 [Zychaea mexicana]|uniref:uncharacterized protein n=1 Tax=Zychaea mexicana TaxID=64656 RepID=UPI0022FDBF77|nr:uncharacterized protein BDB00DRAFT_869139 [Zychaea mexicana]KAI9496910.1 hypothetical protein BDB00DRAFT_869139 [Zychaea mexicana]